MQTERGRGERHVTIEPKIRAMSRHIKECQGLLATETRKDKEIHLSQETTERNVVLPTS